MPTTVSSYRGHRIILNEGIWYYLLNGSAVSAYHDKIGCGFCGKQDTVEGHDGCLGTLVCPDEIINACCGHGDVGAAYVQFAGGRRISGEEAIGFINKIPR